MAQALADLYAKGDQKNYFINADVPDTWSSAIVNRGNLPGFGNYRITVIRALSPCQLPSRLLINPFFYQPAGSRFGSYT